MRIISVKKLKDFWEQGYANSEQPLKIWYQIVRKESFTTPDAIKLLFPSWSIINSNRIVFKK